MRLLKMYEPQWIPINFPKYVKITIVNKKQLSIITSDSTATFFYFRNIAIQRKTHLLDDEVQMVAQLVAQLPELRLPLILEAELERLLGNVVIQSLHPWVGPQQLQALAVWLPQELHPGHEDGAVGAVLRPGLRIRIHFIRIRIQHFRLNTDPDPYWIRIQSRFRALMTKNWKKIQLKKKTVFLDQKLQFTYP